MPSILALRGKTYFTILGQIARRTLDTRYAQSRCTAHQQAESTFRISTIRIERRPHLSRWIFRALGAGRVANQQNGAIVDGKFWGAAGFRFFVFSGSVARLLSGSGFHADVEKGRYCRSGLGCVCVGLR
jgi:hypothetical protein